jgi:radical SAM protein with 4Fe4S-binding SPASM domain
MPLPSAAGLLGTAYRHPLFLQHLVVKKLTTLARYRRVERDASLDERPPMPLGYKLLLTYKCNLRCVMCYEWGEVGWCHDEPRGAVAQELDWELIQKLLAETARRRPYFILFGGEPLLYSKFGDLADLLKEHRCFSITCTNGLLLDRYQDKLSDNPYSTFVVSLDGPERENDLLRGEGVYRKVVRNLRALKSLRRPPYVAAQFTIRPENVGLMYEFCKEMVEIGMDWVLLNPCWFISEGQARAYERFMIDNFQTIPKSHLGYLMPYELDKELFIDQMKKIRSEKWPIQISCYLKRPEDIYTFVDTPEIPTGNTFCYQQWSRMEITPDGGVTPCILYPDLKVGNLRDQGVEEIWTSREFARFRQIRRNEVLPICAKCNSLYLHDSRRKWL